MSTNFCLNLPVSDLPRSRQFYEALGYRIKPEFSGDQCALLVISDALAVMLTTREFFQSLIPSRAVSATREQAGAIFCLSLDSRGEVDTLVDSAIKAGGRSLHEAEDHGFMYERNFEDPDGHLWQVVHMNTGAAANAA